MHLADPKIATQSDLHQILRFRYDFQSFDLSFSSKIQVLGHQQCRGEPHRRCPASTKAPPLSHRGTALMLERHRLLGLKGAEAATPITFIFSIFFTNSNGNQSKTSKNQLKTNTEMKGLKKRKFTHQTVSSSLFFLSV